MTLDGSVVKTQCLNWILRGAKTGADLRKKLMSNKSCTLIAVKQKKINAILFDIVDTKH